MKPNVSANALFPIHLFSAPLANAIRYRVFSLGLLTVLILGTSGCRICADCEDMDYPSYGGSWQRTVRDSGRVASLFDPAGAKAGSMVGRDAPEEVDAQERLRRIESGQDSDDEDEDTDLDSDTSEKDEPAEMDDFKDLDQEDLEEMEDEKSNKLRDLELDDIEVQTLPSTKAPVAMR